MPSEVDAYLSQNSSLFEEQLCELLRIPSVSADSPVSYTHLTLPTSDLV